MSKTAADFQLRTISSNIVQFAADEAFNFDKSDTLNQRTSYDYNSVMHYDRSVDRGRSSDYPRPSCATEKFWVLFHDFDDSLPADWPSPRTTSSPPWSPFRTTT